MQKSPKAATALVIAIEIHHQRGALFSTIPAIRSEIHAIEWLFQTSGRLGIRSTNTVVEASLSDITHYLRWFDFRRAADRVSDRRVRPH